MIQFQLDNFSIFEINFVLLNSKLFLVFAVQQSCNHSDLHSKGRKYVVAIVAGYY